MPEWFECGFWRRVVEAAGENSEFALIKLSELFNHADVMTTRRYLGLRTEELLETYDMLSFWLENSSFTLK